MNVIWIEEVADIFKALSDPTRLQILLNLKDREITVSELSDLSGTSLANVSKHLSLLKRIGIVSRRKSGNFVYYTLCNRDILVIYETLRRNIEERYRPEMEGRTGTASHPDAGAVDTRKRVDRPETLPKETGRSRTVSVSVRKPSTAAPEEEGDYEIHQPGLEGLNGH
jgi:ArsR family transcriptional regulator